MLFKHFSKLAVVSCLLSASAACSSNGGPAANPSSPGGATALFERRYITEIYRAPVGSKIYSIKHHMFRVEHNHNIALFPSDSTFTKTANGDLLVKDSNDPNGVLLLTAANAIVTPTDINGKVVVQPGKTLSNEYSNDANLVEILK